MLECDKCHTLMCVREAIRVSLRAFGGTARSWDEWAVKWIWEVDRTAGAASYAIFPYGVPRKYRLARDAANHAARAAYSYAVGDYHYAVVCARNVLKELDTLPAPVTAAELRAVIYNPNTRMNSYTADMLFALIARLEGRAT